MPRPAKPPMTLKEAKRAYKKDGVGFQYTASQMARADRQDAQEEKRKKALEKDRQRVESKRKRDEKVERERTIKQKMLDEGRITVEDTWGKVAASQPRLNKFFGQRAAAVVPAKRKIQEQIVARGETTVQDVPVADSDEQTHETHEAQPALSSVHEITTPVSKVALGQNGAAEPTFNNEGYAGETATQGTSPRFGRGSLVHDNAQRGDVQSQRSKLRELRPSQINARLNRAQNSQASFKSVTPIKAPKEDLSVPPRQSQTGSQNERVSTPACIVHPLSTESQRHASTPTKDASPGNFDEEDDFTDGIDDDTLLMLCDEQEREISTPSTANASRSPEGLDAEGSAPICFGETGECPPPEPQAKASKVTTSKDKEAIPQSSKGLSESFSSVFNEIDDDDWIAVAERVEASMPSPAVSCTVVSPTTVITPAMPPRKAVASVVKAEAQPRIGMPPPKRSQHPPGRRSSKSSPAPNALGMKATRLAGAGIPSPSGIPRLRTNMPPPKPQSVPHNLHAAPSPDEFVGPGPSTQAMMLELLEQAEARN
ncbi:hypothetical protein LTR13_007025 [Exophiala sideris]|nr:hypothetical protein LTR13_007025 [Exophiala sideris]